MVNFEVIENKEKEEEPKEIGYLFKVTVYKPTHNCSLFINYYDNDCNKCDEIISDISNQIENLFKKVDVDWEDFI